MFLPFIPAILAIELDSIARRASDGTSFKGNGAPVCLLSGFFPKEPVTLFIESCVRIRIRLRREPAVQARTIAGRKS